MRYAAVLAAVLSIATGLSAQKKEDRAGRMPAKGDTVIVQGCLRGQRLESTGISLAEGEGEPLPSAWTYRLQGKKDLLKDLRAQYDGKLVEVTGVLKSELPGATSGKQVGNTRIAIGVDPYGQGRQTPGADQVMPVLDVRSFESSGTACGR